MMATASQKQLALQAALYSVMPRARLMHCRPCSGKLSVLIALPDGRLELIHAETADAPGLEVLADAERARVSSAFLTLAKRKGGSNVAS